MNVSKTVISLIGMTLLPSVAFGVGGVLVTCPDSGDRTGSISVIYSASGGFKSDPVSGQTGWAFVQGEMGMTHSQDNEFNCIYMNTQGDRIVLKTHIQGQKCTVSGNNNNTISCE